MDGKDQQEDEDLFTGVDDVEEDLSYESLLKPVDRPRGILSPTDREYLCGLKDYSHSQTELNRRQSIRERTIEGIRDFNYLWLLLEESEWKKVIEAFEIEELNTAFSSMLASMYIGIDQDTGRMEDIVERGLYLGANYDTSDRWTGKANNVTVEIDIDYEPDVDRLYERIEKGEGAQLTSAEIGALVRAGKIDSEDLSELESNTDSFPGVYVGKGMTTEELENEETE